MSSTFETLNEILARRAAERPEALAYTFLADGEQELLSMTHGETFRRARAIATKLQDSVGPGARAMLLYPPGLDYVAGFFGCLLSGVIAVPAYPPDPSRLGRTLPRLRQVIKDAQATAILTTSFIQGMAEELISHAPELGELRWLATDELEPGVESGWKEPASTRDTVAFLQYTSGSTGTPKGVVLTHHALLSNSAAIRERFGMSESTRVFSWLPPYHDMGLIGSILQPLFVGGECYLMSPLDFLQRPLRWLQAITRHRITTSGGPNFAFDLCSRKVTPEQIAELDLSSWSVAFNGAEPLRGDTLRRFSSTFEPCGFRPEAFLPCYGLAEATLLVSGRRRNSGFRTHEVAQSALAGHEVKPPASPSDSLEVISSGDCAVDHQLVIVEPGTRLKCAPGRVGEIWVRGPSVASGYWNRPQVSRETFEARLADTDEGPFLRTGDLGFVHQGELFVTGRQKDVIIIRGRNHYPQDIERTVDELGLPYLRPGCGAAVAVELDGQERMILVQEVDERRMQREGAEPFDPQATVDAARRAILEAHDIPTHGVVLLRQGTIPKTSSGKIQRHACKELFLEKEREEVLFTWTHQEARPAPPAAASQANRRDIQDWLARRLGAMLGLDARSVDAARPFTHFGLDSASAVELSGDLSEWLGVRLSPALFYDYPTIERLAEHLGKGEDAAGPGEAPRAERTVDEPIAIIGLSCRFPGAQDPEAFWTLLREGVDAIREVPAERWNLHSLYDGTPGTPGKMYTRFGGFLDGVDQFDPGFFGISAREAAEMDPQQRLALEVAWEALERAGLAPDRMAGSRTGVFVGVSNSDYLMLSTGNERELDVYSGTGVAHSIVANRLSYLMDLRGPSVAVDTACSSSLVAVHLACQSLRSGESSTALAGGINVLLSPNPTIAFSLARMMAPDGRCKTFDARADGYVRGEGCGFIVLKRLSDALRDGDPVLAVIRGSAVNQDGRTNGLTAPNGVAQQQVIRQALAQAGVGGHELGYVEAHGTGTSLGDPIEVKALGEVVKPGRPEGSPCALGSVKTNIGHLESAAGIAGLIKVVLSLQAGELPPHLHLEKPNPLMELESYPLEIPTRRRSWAAGQARRIAGISSFGFGGTNAHVVVEEAPGSTLNRARGTEPTVPEHPLHLLTLSARTGSALRLLADRYGSHLEAHPEQALSDICFSANTGRARLGERLALVAEDRDQLLERLRAFASGRSTPGAWSGTASTTPPRVVFLFTGQGAQYLGMGQELYQSEPVFRQALDRCAELLRPHMEEPLLSLLFPTGGEGSRLDETTYTQPALFCLEYALAELWRSWGVVPSAVLGHSLGEYVAACVAGAISLEDALRLVAVRARLMGRLPRGGAMAMVFESEEALAPYLAPHRDVLSIAAFNAPNLFVLSGGSEALSEVLSQLTKAGVRHQALPVSHAFHSPLMEPMLAGFGDVLRGIHFQAPRVPLISNLTGKALGQDELTADYWLAHTRQPVHFARSIEGLAAEGYRIFLELGPKPVLTGLVQRVLASEKDVLRLPSMVPVSPPSTLAAWQTLLSSLAQLHIAGVPVDWEAFDQGRERQRVALPTSPFERQRHWLSRTRTRSISAPNADPMRLHPLVDACAELKQTGGALYTKRFVAGKDRVLSQHVVQGVPILPGVAYLEMALTAARYHLRRPVFQLADVLISQPLPFGPEGVNQTQIALEPVADSPDRLRFTIRSSTGEDRPLVQHAIGEVLWDAEAPAAASLELADIERRCTRAYWPTTLYPMFHRVGIDYGAFFQSIEQVRCNDQEMLVRLCLTNSAAEDRGYVLHPALMDAALQGLAALIDDPATVDRKPELYVPFSVDHLYVYGALPEVVVAHGIRRGNAGDGEILRSDVRLMDETGRVLVTFEGICLKRVNARQSISAAVAAQTTGPHQLEAVLTKLRPQGRKLEALYGLDRYSPFTQEIERLSGIFAVQALRRMGWTPRPGEQVSASHLAETLRVAPAHRRLFGRLLEMLREDGVLQAAEDGSLVLREFPEPVEPRALYEALIERFPACEAEVSLFSQCGEQLAAVLQGTCNPLQILFPGGSLSATEALYQESPFSRLTNSLVQAAVTAEAERLGRPLRILEVGAGTGGTTTYVLPSLAGKGSEYVFTDVSQLFLYKAQQKFALYPFVRYQLLDIERVPSEQGFGAHEFDVIIAANVLHATAELSRTLGHLRQLLASQGTLVILELVGQQRGLDLIFGLTEGWWKFADAALRPSYPLITSERWHKVLSDAGFVESVHLPEKAGTPGNSGQAVFVARGPRVSQRDVRVVAPAQVAAPAVVAPTPAPALASVTAAAMPSTLAAQGSAGGTERDAGHWLRSQLVAQVGRSLRQDPSQLSMEKSFLDMGIDSLMAVEIMGTLKKELGVPLSPTMLFEHPNIGQLASFLTREYSGQIVQAMKAAVGDTPKPPPAPAPSTLFQQSQALASLPPAPVTPSPTPPPVVVSPVNGVRTEEAPVSHLVAAPHLNESSGSGDIAIIGMACNFPQAPNLDAFWDVLTQGKDAIREIPPERWDWRAHNASRYGAFLEGIDMFDPLFFEIAPKEARLIDPQQRLFLEVAWEALEHAGYAGAVSGTNTGVFVGCTNTDYFDRIRHGLTADDYPAGLGNKNCIIPNRLSYFLNVNGPSTLVDTACSSSLVALHMACDSLRRNECTMAVAGGVNILMSPQYYGALYRMGVQSPDGRCKAFDHRANGFASGEGAGAVILKPLARALADGDTVYAVIKGSAINHGGRSNGLPAPNPAAHAAVIAAAYANAGLSPDTVSYIEAHGTGTSLGDPIEIAGLTTAFRRYTQRKGFCAIGSVKTNIAHLEPAAAIASVIKVVLSLTHRQLPASLHFEQPNPGLGLADSPFWVNTQLRPWEASGPRRAGISSFGMGGANGHAIIEEAPVQPSVRRQARSGYVLPITARTEEALARLVQRYQAHLVQHPEQDLAEICFTASVGRPHFRHRAAVLARTPQELRERLERLASGGSGPGIHRGVRKGLADDDHRLSVPDGAAAPEEILREVAERYVQGASIDWSSLYPAAEAHRRVALPTYPFERQRCWVDAPEATAGAASRPRAPSTQAPSHPLLGKRIT